MWSITDPLINNRGPKPKICMCQPTSVWDVICSGTTASGVPRDLGSTFPALSWHCVCTYPVSTPFPTCFHAFSSKLYSFYFLQSFLLNVFFFFSLLLSNLSNFLSLQIVPDFFCWITQLTFVLRAKTTKTREEVLFSCFSSVVLNYPWQLCSGRKTPFFNSGQKLHIQSILLSGCTKILNCSCGTGILEAYILNKFGRIFHTMTLQWYFPSATF